MTNPNDVPGLILYKENGQILTDIMAPRFQKQEERIKALEEQVKGLQNNKGPSTPVEMLYFLRTAPFKEHILFAVKLSPFLCIASLVYLFFLNLKPILPWIRKAI